MSTLLKMLLNEIAYALAFLISTDMNLNLPSFTCPSIIDTTSLLFACDSCIFSKKMLRLASIVLFEFIQSYTTGSRVDSK